MEQKVSVIIPIYNVEDYLAECLDSVCNQTYQNLEIILIDDGSTDRSGEIGEAYAKRDARIKVIHQQNGGAGKAKNTGLKSFTGDLLVFADSDDILPLDSIEYRVNLLEKYDADIVQGSFRTFENKDELSEQNSETETKETVVTNVKFLQNYLRHWENAVFWNKLFKAETVKNLFFPVGRCIDDEFFTYKTIFKSKKIVVSDHVLYEYRQRAESAIHNVANEGKKLFDQMDFMHERYIDMKQNYPALKKMYLHNLVENYIQFYHSKYFQKEHEEHMKAKLKEMLKDLLFIPYRMSLKMVILKWYLQK